MLHNVQYIAVTVITFIVILGVLVIVHELGHFLAARLFKVRVEEFAVGFPPRVFPRRERVEQLRKEGKTVYSINALPLGGFVRLAGENGVSAGGGAQSAPGVNSLSLAGDVASADDPGAFASKPAWQRAIVLAAGPFNNMVLAMALVFLMFIVVGTPQAAIGIAGVAIQSPAQAAGIMPGDVIRRIDGIVPRDSLDVHNMVIARRGKPITLELQRGNRLISVRLTPRRSWPQYQGPIGVLTDAADVRYQPTDPGTALGAALNVPGAVVGGIASLIGQLGSNGSAAPGSSSGGGSSGQEPAVTPPTTPGAPVGCGPPDYVTFGGRITGYNCINPPNVLQTDACLTGNSAGGITGPIGIIRQVGCEANAIPTQGWLPLLTLVVELSATLAIMNLLPIPALDGGRLLFVAISAVSRKRIRPEVEGMAHALGMMALLTLMFIISFNDLMNLINNRPAF